MPFRTWGRCSRRFLSPKGVSSGAMIPVTDRKCNSAAIPLDQAFASTIMRPSRQLSPKTLQWKRRLRQRTDGQRDQHQFTVIAPNPIRVERAAATAAVNNRPVSTGPHPHGDRFHRAVAVGSAISRNIVQVFTPQTRRAVIPVSRSRGFACNLLSAMDTAEPGGGLPASVPPKILLSQFSFLHGHTLSKWRVGCARCDTRRRIGRQESITYGTPFGKFNLCRRTAAPLSKREQPLLKPGRIA